MTSASYGCTLGRCVAYAWLPTLANGTGVHIEYFGEKVPQRSPKNRSSPRR